MWGSRQPRQSPRKADIMVVDDYDEDGLPSPTSGIEKTLSLLWQCPATSGHYVRKLRQGAGPLKLKVAMRSDSYFTSRLGHCFKSGETLPDLAMHSHVLLITQPKAQPGVATPTVPGSGRLLGQTLAARSSRQSLTACASAAARLAGSAHMPSACRPRGYPDW